MRETEIVHVQVRYKLRHASRVLPIYITHATTPVIKWLSCTMVGRNGDDAHTFSSLSMIRNMAANFGDRQAERDRIVYFCTLHLSVILIVNG